MQGRARSAQLPGKGASRPRLPRDLRPTRRLGEARRPQEAPGGHAGREEPKLAHLGGARGPTGTKSGGARPAGRRLGSGASPARSPRPRRRPQPEANAAEPGRAKTGNRLSRQPSGRHTSSGGSGVIGGPPLWEAERSEEGGPWARFPEMLWGLGLRQQFRLRRSSSFVARGCGRPDRSALSPERAEVGRGGPVASSPHGAGAAHEANSGLWVGGC